tara:strand:+ start:342 stop:593 length:252 start_codon:yes stop_codon:yes gene_type:complete
MNKAKLVKLADEVLSEIDVDMQCVLRKQLEIDLCERLSRKFNQARYHLEDSREWKKHKPYEQTYISVKPILDDCIDKLLGETK